MIEERDFAEIDEIIELERNFYPPVPTQNVGEEDSLPSKFIANLAQSKFRAAAISGKYDTLIAAGTISSSKTYGLIALIIDLCLEFEETHGLVVRSKWDTLVDNTIPDFVDILSALPPEMYSWPNRLNLHFWNGSKIQFRPAREQQDPGFAWLKGKKLDFVFGDEYDHFSPEFVSMLQSRVGVERRRANSAARRCPALSFFACNPNIGPPKEIYSRHIHNNASLVRERIYFQLFTIQDNIAFISPQKIAQWKRVMTPPMYKRFVEGSWEAMSDREQLIVFEYMDKCRDLIPPRLDAKGKPIAWAYYLGVDPAHYGPDKCAFLLLHGPNIYRLDFFNQTMVPEITAYIKKLMAEFNIRPEHVTVDAIGLGAGVVDELHSEKIWVNRFKGSESPDDAAFYTANPEDPNSNITMDNYNFTFLNKRASAFWELMQMMRDGKIGGLNPEVLGWNGDVNIYEVLRQDLASVHYFFAKGTKSIQMEDKEDIKKRLKRSPDFADVLKYALQSYLHDSKAPSMAVYAV